VKLLVDHSRNGITPGASHPDDFNPGAIWNITSICHDNPP
jgi:hypothetical protein